MTTSPSDPSDGDATVPDDVAPGDPAETPEEQIASTQEATEDATDAPIAEGDEDTAGVADEEPQPADAGDQPAEPDRLEALAAELATVAGATGWSAEHGTIKLKVGRDGWHGAVATLSGRLPFFGWLSAVDWSREVAVGEPAEAPDRLEERYEVLCRLSSVTDASAAILSADVPKEDAWMPSIVDVLPGAGWHERETAEMFGLDFRGNPNLAHLYLPDAFEGHPLRKSFPLLSREVKPWPGTVDVEAIPGTENVEAGDTAGSAEAAGDEPGAAEAGAAGGLAADTGDEGAAPAGTDQPGDGEGAGEAEAAAAPDEGSTADAAAPVEGSTADAAAPDEGPAPVPGDFDPGEHLEVGGEG